MCAIFGVVNVDKATELTVIGLHANQHRGRDYAGIASSDGDRLYREAGKGRVAEIFTKKRIDDLHGRDALGHTRYPTVKDDKNLENIQPIIGKYGKTPMAIAHNGNITNLANLKKIVPEWAISTSMDTEYILRLIQMEHTGNLEADLVSVFAKLEGSFSLGILLPDRLIAVRDKSGNRPLSIGKLDNGFCVSSEDSAFANIDARVLQEVEAGTMAFLGSDGISIKRFAEPCEKKCRFEAIYFSKPVSDVFGEDVGDFRMKIGRTLEEIFPVPEADVVIGIPDSGTFMAIGYGESGRSGRYDPRILRSHYADRTFIAANQAMRDEMVAQKFAFGAKKIEGKTVVVVDDSIVRGTTLPKLIGKLRWLGAKTIHARIGSPPITNPCIYGINTPTSQELIAASNSTAEICRKIGADSLEFLPLQALKKLSPNPEKFCFTCMDGEYW